MDLTTSKLKISIFPQTNQQNIGEKIFAKVTWNLCLEYINNFANKQKRKRKEIQKKKMGNGHEQAINRRGNENSY